MCPCFVVEAVVRTPRTPSSMGAGASVPDEMDEDTFMKLAGMDDIFCIGDWICERSTDGNPDTPCPLACGMPLVLLLGRAPSIQYHMLTSLTTAAAERFASLKNEDGKVKKSALTLPSGAGCDNIILLSDSYKVSPITTTRLLP